MWLLGEQLFTIEDGEVGFIGIVDTVNHTMELELRADYSSQYSDLVLEVGTDYLLPEEFADGLNVGDTYLTEGDYYYDSNLGEYGGYVVDYYTTP